MNEVNQQILRITTTSDPHVRKGIHRTTENTQLFVTFKWQIKTTFDYFLEIPQAVKERKARKCWAGTPDLWVKEREAEVTRDFFGFQDSVVNSTTLCLSFRVWLQGIKGCIVKPVCQVAADTLGWKDTFGISREILQGETRGASQNKQRVQKDPQKQLLSSCKGFVWLQGWYGFYCILSDAQAY